MNSFLEKIKIKTAVQPTLNKFNLSRDHYTTQDFFKQKPVYLHECVPGERFSMNLKSFSRLTPLTKPMYGSVKMVNRAFAVPLRLLMNNFNEFITQVPVELTIPSSVPYVTNTDFVQLFINQSLGFTVETAGAQSVRDFLIGSGSSAKSYTFTKTGRNVYDILLSLGYQINWTTDSLKDGDHMSALPIIAYYKIFDDWYSNAQFQVSFFHKFDPGQHIGVAELSSMLIFIENTQYEKDYFTSAWVNPSGSATIQPSVIVPDTSLVDVASNTKSRVTTTLDSSHGTPVINRADTNVIPGSISQNSLDWVKRVTDFVKRNQLVGSRVVDRFRAMFGLQLESAKLERSIYLGVANSSLNVADVTCTSNDTATDLNDTKQLGNYAGKAIGGTDGKFSYNSDEFCYIIVVSSVIPHIGYYQGRDRIIYHTNKFDFFDGSFDYGVQPIRQDELITQFGNKDNIPSSYKSSAVFGWSSRYAEYKTQPHDILSGNFAIPTMSAGLDCWHLMRHIPMSSTQAVINPDFCTGEQAQYDRIFNFTDEDYDHIFTIFHFDVVAYRPMRKMFDDYDFEGGRDIAVELNGTQLN